MANLVSPGVQVKEIDLTNVVPSVSSTIGAMAGAFTWGPANEICTVTSETQLVEKFGEPNADTFESVLSAAQFLSYGNNLKVVRAVGTSARNATASGTGILTQNKTVFDGQSPAAGDWAQARYPGVRGNAVGVSVLTAGQTGTAWQLSNVEGVPGTSAGAAAVGGSNDEIHLWVYDVDGTITGAVGTVLEYWTYLSQASDVKGSDGSTLYYKDVINAGSEWVFIGNAPAALSESGNSAVGETFVTVASFFIALTGGIDDNVLSVGETTAGYALMADAETIDTNLIFQANSSLSAADTRTLSNFITAQAAARKDAVGFVSPERAATVNAAAPATSVAAWRTALTSTSYGFADSGSLYVYDKYNDVYRWIAAAGSMAGLSANADLVADAWFSPAGFTRGNVRNVTKLAWNPNQAERDALYKTGVNPVVTFPGQGTVLFGDKTLQSKPSAFDRINVRRLFIVLEQAVSVASKASLFEFNDEFTRAQFRNMVEPFLRDVQGRRGITDFKVVCDGTNNTGAIIDTNKFVADIYIKPARSINFITLNFIATRTGVEFSEIAGGN
jgi:phage tail sheath protein FI